MSELKGVVSFSREEIIERMKDRLHRNRSLNETTGPTKPLLESQPQSLGPGPTGRRRRVPKDWYINVQRSTSLNETTSPTFENEYQKKIGEGDINPESANQKHHKCTQTNYVSYETFSKTNDTSRDVVENDQNDAELENSDVEPGGPSHKQTQTYYVNVEKSTKVNDMLKDMRTRRVLSERTPPLPVNGPPIDILKNKRSDPSQKVFDDKVDSILRKEQTSGYPSVYGNRGSFPKSYTKGKFEREAPRPQEHDDYFKKKYEEIDKIEATWSGKSDEFARVNNHLKKLQEVFEDLSTYNNNLASHLNRMVGVANEHTEQITKLEGALQRNAAELNHWKGAYETLASKTKKMEGEIDNLYAIVNKTTFSEHQPFSYLRNECLWPKSLQRLGSLNVAMDNRYD